MEGFKMRYYELYKKDILVEKIYNANIDLYGIAVIKYDILRYFDPSARLYMVDDSEPPIGGRYRYVDGGWSIR
jgi:hypothetical protein